MSANLPDSWIDSHAVARLLAEIRERRAALPPIEYDEYDTAIWGEERQAFDDDLRDLARAILRAGGADGLGGCLLCKS